MCLLCCLPSPAGRLQAEDSDQLRPYFSVRRGEFNYLWGPKDEWGLNLGLNLNRYVGVEMALDTWENILSFPELGGHALGEESATSFIPEIRLRYPLFHDTLVPYVVGGVGGSFYQFNDRKEDGFGREIEAEDFGWSAALGGGLDWFVADNIALNLEVKQVWHSGLDVTVDSETYQHDPSDIVATLGFRVFLAENHPKPLAGAGEDSPIRMYLGLQAGTSIITDDHWSGDVGWTPEAAAWGGTFIQHFGGKVGIDLGRHWGVELTAEGNQPNVHINGVGDLSDYALATFIPSVRYRIPFAGGRWNLYGLAGVGMSFGEANDYKPVTEGIQFDSKGTYFPAFSAGGGAEYFIARNLSFSAETRWTYVGNHEFEYNGQHGSGDYSQVQLMLVLRLYLLEL